MDVTPTTSILPLFSCTNVTVAIIAHAKMKTELPSGTRGACHAASVTFLLGCPFFVLFKRIEGGFVVEASTSAVLTVYHNGQFWNGIFEIYDHNKLSACRIVFVSEPSSEEILELIVRGWNALKFSAAIEVHAPKTSANPKRRQREAAKQLNTQGVSAKSHQALSEQIEASKTAHKKQRQERRNQERQERFEKKAAKRKKKHRGH